MENHYFVVWCYTTLKVNNNKWVHKKRLTGTDICFFGKIGDWNGDVPQKATHLILSLFVNCKIVIRVCLLNWWKGKTLQCQGHSSSVKNVSEITIIIVSS